MAHFNKRKFEIIETYECEIGRGGFIEAANRKRMKVVESTQPICTCGSESV